MGILASQKQPAQGGRAMMATIIDFPQRATVIQQLQDAATQLRLVVEQENIARTLLRSGV
jgi:hypothetical protein